MLKLSNDISVVMEQGKNTNFLCFWFYAYQS